MSKINHDDFGVCKPDKNDVKKTIEKVQKRYNIMISENDATEYTRLHNELEQWFLMEENIDSKDSIANEMTGEMKEILKGKRGLELGTDSAQAISKESLKIIIPREKEQIKKEITAIIEKYK